MAFMKKDRLGSSILRRLDILILLALEEGKSASKSVVEKIERLSSFGLSSAEIATILGKPTNYVTASISQLKRRTKKRGR